jgi:RNA polymerase sigma factor (sigma-70 family)
VVGIIRLAPCITSANYPHCGRLLKGNSSGSISRWESTFLALLSLNATASNCSLTASKNQTRACGQVLVMPMNDSEIIHQSLGEPEVFGAIFDRHFESIAAFCVRRTGRDRGEDAAGDVFRWAFEHRQRFDFARDSARPWLFGIAHNLVRRALRTAGRQGLAFDRWMLRETIEGTDVASHVTVVLDAQRDLSAVMAVLKEQPDEEVDALLLFAWEQLSYVEVAEALSVPVGTVRSRIHRLRHTLQEALDAPMSSFQVPTINPGG